MGRVVDDFKADVVMGRIGILGGTFDPPHLGHLILGEYAADVLGLECVLFVPAADPPHKQDAFKLSVEHRLAMLERALVDNERFVLSRLDVDRPGPHYSLDMVQLVAQQFPQAELFFLMGGDSLRDLPKWHRPAELIQYCKLAVMQRPDSSVRPEMHEAILPGLATRVVMLDAPLIDISSTQITEWLRTGRSIRYFVPEAVRIYIETNHLYGK